MKTIMIIAIYADGDRLIAETSQAKSSKDWQAKMKQVGDDLKKQAGEKKIVVSVVVIDGTNVAQYEASEITEIFGLRA